MTTRRFVDHSDPYPLRHKSFAVGFELAGPTVGTPRVTRNFEATTRWDDVVRFDGGQAFASLGQDGHATVRITRDGREGGVEFELRNTTTSELQALVRTLEAVCDELAERR